MGPHVGREIRRVVTCQRHCDPIAAPGTSLHMAMAASRSPAVARVSRVSTTSHYGFHQKMPRWNMTVSLLPRASAGEARRQGVSSKHGSVRTFLFMKVSLPSRPTGGSSLPSLRRSSSMEAHAGYSGVHRRRNARPTAGILFRPGSAPHP